jgi:hypothetical protein
MADIATPQQVASILDLVEQGLKKAALVSGSSPDIRIRERLLDSRAVPYFELGRSLVQFASAGGVGMSRDTYHIISDEPPREEHQQPQYRLSVNAFLQGGGLLILNNGDPALIQRCGEWLGRDVSRTRTPWPYSRPNEITTYLGEKARRNRREHAARLLRNRRALGRRPEPQCLLYVPRSVKLQIAP